MRFEVAQRVVRDELGKSSPENEFTPRGFVEADTALGALKRFLDREQAVVLGPIEKTRDKIVSNVGVIDPNGRAVISPAGFGWRSLAIFFEPVSPRVSERTPS